MIKRLLPALPKSVNRLKTAGDYGPSTSISTSKLSRRPNDIKKLNDSVWEFCTSPSGGDGFPKVEVLFFHGVQLSQDTDSFWKTWLSRDETIVWPTTWLAQEFTEARILFISYDSVLRKPSGSFEQRDTYQTMENLMEDIIWSSKCKAGKKCPVILVGHCFGGIIIKDFLVTCSEYTGRNGAEDSHVEKIKSFLQHCKAVFFYSTPNAGSGWMDGLAYQDYILGNVNRSLVDFLEILSRHTARINSKFNQLRRCHPEWVIQGIGETLETKLRKSRTPTMVVPEASARLETDDMYWTDADHFDVSKAKDNSSCIIFTKLRDLLADYYNMGQIVTSLCFRRDNNMGQAITSPLPFGRDKRYVPFRGSIYHVQKALEKKSENHVVTVYGIPGSGKTSLVKNIALHYQPHHKPKVPRKASSAAVFPNGVVFLHCGQGADCRIRQLQRHLLESLGCGSEDVPVNMPEEHDGVHVVIPGFRRRLQFKLQELKALIILDDVWERRVMEELILSADEARSVKYLLTSERRDIWPDATNFRMENPTIEEARQILVRYTEGFSTETDFPENIKEIVDSLIALVDRHPLTLANLGLGMPQGEAQEPEAWKSVLHQWEHYPLIKQSYEPVIYGSEYSFPLDRTMTRVMLLLDKCAQRLLILMSAMDPFVSTVPDATVKYFFNCAKLGNMSEFRHAINYLQNRSLVDVFGTGDSKRVKLHKLRALSIRSRYPEKVQGLVQRAVQPLLHMCNHHGARLTQCEEHSADVINGHFNALVAKARLSKPFLKYIKGIIPASHALVLDNLYVNPNVSAGVSNHLFNLLDFDSQGKGWKQEADTCAKKALLMEALHIKIRDNKSLMGRCLDVLMEALHIKRRDNESLMGCCLDDESLGRLIELPQTRQKALRHLRDSVRHGDFKFQEEDPTFLSIHSHIARNLFALLHDRATSTETLYNLVDIFLGHFIYSGCLLDGESDDTIVDIGGRLLMLVLGENGNVVSECGGLQKFSSHPSRALRVIEEKLPDVWKALWTSFVRRATRDEWFSSSSREGNAGSKIRVDTRDLFSESGPFYYFFARNLRNSRCSPFDVLEALSAEAENRESLSGNPKIMVAIEGILVHVAEGEERNETYYSVLLILENLCLSRGIRRKIRNMYPQIVEALKRILHNRPTLPVRLCELLLISFRIYLGRYEEYDSGLLDGESDDTIVNIGAQLLKLAFRENGNVVSECGGLQKFPSNRSRAFRVIEEKLPNLWKALWSSFVRQATPDEWFSSSRREGNIGSKIRGDTTLWWFSSSRREDNLGSKIRVDRTLLDVLYREAFYYLCARTSDGPSWYDAFGILEVLSTQAENAESLSENPKLMAAIVGILVHVAEGGGRNETYDSVLNILHHLWLSQEIQLKIRNIYPQIVEALEQILENLSYPGEPSREARLLSLS